MPIENHHDLAKGLLECNIKIIQDWEKFASSKSYKVNNLTQDMKLIGTIISEGTNTQRGLALNIMGCFYVHGWGGQPINYDSAFDFFNRAVELENPFAMYNLAMMYEDGHGTPQNYGEAIRLYNRAVKLENSDAMVNLAYNYEKGLGTTQNYGGAIKLYNRAVELKNPRAMVNLATMYHNGHGTAQNYKQAITLYERASALGHPSAMFNLANMYQRGRGTTQNYGEAIKLYKCAVELGHPKAMFTLANMYENGVGTPENLSKAIALYKKIINLKNNDKALINEANTRLTMLFRKNGLFNGTYKTTKASEILKHDTKRTRSSSSEYIKGIHEAFNRVDIAAVAPYAPKTEQFKNIIKEGQKKGASESSIENPIQRRNPRSSTNTEKRP